MKYPQLVSTRAVNAISDWLVSRLEQIGVEAPLIYSRLLLSLLNSSVQINDPIEFNNLETYLTNRKGNRRHNYLPTDTDTLKKLTAIQCLKEAVSSDQEISKIETLVDELCVKLNEIEKQLNSDDQKEYQTIGQILNFISVVGSTSETETEGNYLEKTFDKNSGKKSYNILTTRNSNCATATAKSSYTVSSTPLSSIATPSASMSRNSSFVTNLAFNEDTNKYFILENNKNSINLNIIPRLRNSSHKSTNKTRTIVGDSENLKEDIEQDPRKRYYNAFPALTKEMEDSFRQSNRYTKALTWPNDKQTTSFINQQLSTNNNTNMNYSNNTNINSNTFANTNNINKNTINIINNNSSTVNKQNEIYFRNSNNTGNFNTAGVKRKSKRRRNQGLSKGRSITIPTTSAQTGYYPRKNSISGNCSPTWDTDFEGSWEMGRDLIKEFIAKENNRNRSTSESAAYNVSSSNNNNNSIHITNMNKTSIFDKKNKHDVSDGKKNVEKVEINFNPIKFKCSTSPSGFIQNEIPNTTSFAFSSSFKLRPSNIVKQSNELNSLQIIDQNNLLSDEGYSTHENLTSLSELDTSGIETLDSNLQTNEKLYEICEIPNEQKKYSNVLISPQRRLYERDLNIQQDNDDSSISLCSSNVEQQQNDFAQFKAKFDSSVEALWKDNSNNQEDKQNLFANQQFDQNENSNISNNSDEIKSLPPFIFQGKQQQQNQERQGLNNFWLNYYNHCYDPTNKFGFNNNIYHDNDGKNKEKLQIQQNENFVEQRDFYSIPNQMKLSSAHSLNNDLFLLTGNSDTTNNNEALPLITTTFLQDSIWSDSNKNYDDDESFYANVKKSLQQSEYKENDSNCHFEIIYDQHPQDIIAECQEGISEITIKSDLDFSNSSDQNHQQNTDSPIATNLNYEIKELIITDPNLYNFLQQTLQQHQQQQDKQIHQEENESETYNYIPISSDCTVNPNCNEAIFNSFQTQNLDQIRFNESENNLPYGVNLYAHTENNQNFPYSFQNQHIDDIHDEIVNYSSVSNYEQPMVTLQITLQNHDKTSSAFVEYSKIKEQNFELFQYNQYEKNPNISIATDTFINNSNNNNENNSTNSAAAISAASACNDEENLLTSSLTHFRPIKQTYTDGYVFDICNYLDEINYERSESGFLCYEGEKYLEYTKLELNNSTGYYEEDRQQHNHSGRANAQRKSNQSLGKKRNNDDFVLKFRVNDKNEKYCQTDPITPYNFLQLQQNRNLHETELLQFGRLNSDNLPRMNSSSGLSGSSGNGGFSQNYFQPGYNYYNQCGLNSNTKYTVNYYYDDEFTKSDSSSSDDYEKFDIESSSLVFNLSGKRNCSNIESAKAAAALILAAVSNTNNQYGDGMLMKCSVIEENLNIKPTIEIGNNVIINDVENNLHDGTNNNDNHSLWSTCAACKNATTNQECEQSLPANHLLKDELKIEGDRIMSDLKSMQDLYIGSDWEEGTCSSTTSNSSSNPSSTTSTNSNSSNEIYTDSNLPSEVIETDSDNKEHTTTVTEHESQDSNDSKYGSDDYFCEKIDQNILDDSTLQTADLYYNVTKLIADLLKPENAKSLANALGEAAIQAASVQAQFNNKNNDLEEVNNLKYENYCGGLWTNDDHFIWKQDELKPIDNYLTQFNCSTNNEKQQETSNKKNLNLQWEYANLANLWQETDVSKLNPKTKGSCLYYSEQENTQYCKTGNESKQQMKQHINNQFQGNNFADKGDADGVLENIDLFKASATNFVGKKLDQSRLKFSHLTQSQELISESNLDGEQNNGILKANRFDRKRRHSGAQMYSDLNIFTENNNNNPLAQLSSTTTNLSSNMDQKHIFSKAEQNIPETPSIRDTTINNVFDDEEENLRKFELSNNCKNFLNNCQNIIDGGNKIFLNNINENNYRKSYNLYENIIVDRNTDITKNPKNDLLIQTGLIVGKITNAPCIENNVAFDNDCDSCQEYNVVTSTTDENIKFKGEQIVTEIIDNTNDCGDGDSKAIFSCNYWSLDPKISMNTEFWQTNASQCLDYDKFDGITIINPSSILKHVALVSRPLTR